MKVHVMGSTGEAGEEMSGNEEEGVLRIGKRRR
jgi:hypothetical protein